MQSKQKKVKKIMKNFFPVPYIYTINIWLFAGKKKSAGIIMDAGRKNQKF